MGTLHIGGLVAGLVGGLLSGIFGIGGGIVLVPLLALLVGLGQQEAQGVTLAVLLLPIGLPAVLAYRKRVAIRWWLVAALVAGFVTTVGPGASAAIAVGERPLEVLFGVLLLVAAAQVWKAASAATPTVRAPDGERRSDWNGLWIGAIGGLLAGLFGIGGGIVMVPLLVAAMGLDQHEAQATTLAAMLPPIGIPGVLTYVHARGGLPWELMAAVAVGFAAGAFGGAHLAVRTRNPPLARAFAVLLVAVAARLAWKALQRS